jgi:hypothetical protein
MSESEDDALMDDDMEEFLAAGKKSEPAVAVAEAPREVTQEEAARAAKKDKKDSRFGRKVETAPEDAVAPEDASLWQQRLKVLWDDYLIRTGRPSDRKTRFYKCLDPRCGLIVEALTTEARAELPDGHPERVVRCPNIGTDKHLKPGISSMDFVD